MMIEGNLFVVARRHSTAGNGLPPYTSEVQKNRHGHFAVYTTYKAARRAAAERNNRITRPNPAWRATAVAVQTLGVHHG